MRNPTDWRALCAELANELQGYKAANPMHCRDLLERARAELAKPEPEGVALADAEIQEWADSSWVVPLEEQRHDGDDWRICFTHEEFCDAIREALSRWGNPTIQSERDESVMDRLIAAPMDSRGYVDLRPGRTASAQPEPEEVTLDCDEIDVPAYYRGDDVHVYEEGYTAGWAAGTQAMARPTP
jgi:hypothetical protein